MRDPKSEFLNDMKYSSEGEYIASIFVLLDLMLFRDPGKRLRDRGLTPDQDLLEWIELLKDRTEMTVLCGETPAMEKIIQKTEAPWLMHLVLGFLLRCTLEPIYETEAAAEIGSSSLNLYELISMLGSPAEREDPVLICSLLEELRPAMDLLFPQIPRREQATGQSMAGLMPVIDGRLAAVLLGRAPGENLPDGMELYSPEEDAAPGTGQEQSAELLKKRRESLPPEITAVWGREGSGKRTAMKTLAGLLRQKVLFYTLQSPRNGTGPEDGDPAGEALLRERLYPELLRLRRDCVLYGWIPAIIGADRFPKNIQTELLSFLKTQFIPKAGGVYLLMESDEVPDHLPGCFYLQMKELKSADRIRLWEEILAADACISRETIGAISNTFALTAGQIRDAAEQAVRLAGPENRVSEELIYQACYAKLGHPLKKHTQHVRSPFVWEDLKMDPRDKAVLKDLCSCVRNRHIVMQEWNFEKKVPYGSGITGVFAGPPGTGKTMAAQVIANELRMELYKVDLSQLIDKYVGETEKNIKRVFDLAGRSNSVLFFDEADAIFNKRLSADNSNDRFANIESSLLLQCIEDFSGVTLLATNNMGSIDAAFIRRFRFYLQFKEPDEDIRYEIWSSVFPPEAPVRPEVDFRELARIFRFTGAIIKNVAMQAAYLAAERGEGIGMLEIMVAVRRELQKEQRMLSRDLMGKYEYLFPEVINWNSGLKEEREGTV